MRAMALSSVVERRLLVNYRMDPEYAASRLPPVERAVSSVYDAYPSGAAALDCALVMTDVSVRWQSRPELAAA